MGSAFHARGMRQRGERAAAMLSLETIGCFRDAEGSQRYPFPLSLFYPSHGDFVAFVGNVESRRLVKRAIATFRQRATVPSEGGALPGFLPGISWSDHWAFWKQGFPGAMVTDTAPFRYPYYHTAEDTPEKIDYERTARVVAGLVAVAKELAGLPPDR
jgi:Zn-dependent M28 family amino/carboxypeptidase